LVLLVGLRFVAAFVVLPIYNCSSAATQTCKETLARADTQIDVLSFVSYCLVVIFVVSLSLLLRNRFRRK
jgi:hypothetical protein